MTDPRTGPSDTAPEIDEMQIEGYRRMSGAERIARVLDMNHAVDALAAGAEQLGVEELLAEALAAAEG